MRQLLFAPGKGGIGCAWRFRGLPTCGFPGSVNKTSTHASTPGSCHKGCTGAGSKTRAHWCWRSSLIAACERAGELDQALALVDSMHAAGVSHSPDLYAKLLERCAPATVLGWAAVVSRWQAYSSGLRTNCPVFVGGVRLTGLCVGQAMCHTIHLFLVTNARVLRRRLGTRGQWQQALDLFLTCQMAGAEATKGVCLALLSALENARQPRPALQVGKPLL